MNWSEFFIPTLKEAPKAAEAKSHKLMIRGGLVHMLTSGVYSYLPLGLRVLKRVEYIIREEMEKAGARELFLPCLQPIELWKQTGRDKDLKDVMYRFTDGRGRDMCLGPTHEEVITDLVKNFVQSYQQLPIVLYQIQTKFRDELRVRYGVVRACEFIMKDAYSFDRDEKGLKKNYDLMFQAYKNIFDRCDLEYIITEADSGAMGGDVSHEFMVPAAIGEDTIKVNGKDQVCMELGHIFQLGTKYSKAQEALFEDADGKQKPIIMGCYGIGVSRVIAAIIETHSDENGIIWPKEIAPFDVELLPISGKEMNEEITSLCESYYKELSDKNIDVLVDDRDETAGRKFNDADLIGIPTRITIGQKNLKDGNVEIKDRASNETTLVSKDELVAKIMESHS